MTKEDWTTLGLKLLGIYFVIIYGSSLVTQSIVALAVFKNESGAMWKGYYAWQGPATCLVTILASIVLIWKTEKIVALIWRK